MNTLSIVVWTAGSHQFALPASQVAELRPYLADSCSIGLHQLMTDVPATPLQFCLGWQANGQSCNLAVNTEPRHVELPLDNLWPLPMQLQQARQHPAICALAWYQDRPLLLLDTRQLPCR